MARNECHRRLRTAIPSASLYEAAEAMDDTGQLSAITEHAELRALVRAALAELDPVERELSELNLRHGLLGADLAAVLGVPRDEAQALASRARARFERSLDVLMVARSEQDYCSDLAAILDGWGRKPTVLLRRRVRRHIKRCAACSERKRGDLSAAMLLSMLTVPVLPADLRERILGLVAGASADTASYHAQVLDRVQPFGADGFPVQLDDAVNASPARHLRDSGHRSRRGLGLARRRHVPRRLHLHTQRPAACRCYENIGAGLD